MASIDRYRPTREGYQPPALPSQPKPGPTSTAAPSAPSIPGAPPPPPALQNSDPQSQSQSVSPTSTRRRDVPPAVPSPPAHSHRTSPPHRPLSRKSASPQRRPSIHSLSQPQSQTQFQSQSQHQNYQPPPSLSASQPRPMSQSSSNYNNHNHNHNGNGSSRSSNNNNSSSNNNQPPFASQWFYTEEELISTPSVLHGLSPAEERERRAKGVNFIYQSGIAVHPRPLPQMTLYVAAVFFHRFYMRVSMVEERGGIHHYKIAATALFLANKTEENCFKTKTLIIAVAKVAQKNMDLIVDEQSKEYWRWRDSILTYEELMLETLTFDLMVANPYDRLWVQLRKLGQLGCKPVREAAWTFLNDAALTTLPLLLDAGDLASASIFFASIASGEKLDDVQGQPWWQSVRADEARITRATHLMAAFYKENPLRKQQPGGRGGLNSLGGGGGGSSQTSNGRAGGGSSPIFQLETTRRPHELSQLNSRRYLDSASAGGGGGGGAMSRDVTPMELDRQPQTQGVSQSESQSQSQSQTQGASQSQQLPLAAAADAVPGDSDAVLKAVANDTELHQHDGDGLAVTTTNGAAAGDRKRKSADPDEAPSDNRGGHGGVEEADDDGRPAKRARRLSSADEMPTGETARS